MKDTLAQISVLVLTKNRHGLFARCLQSIAHQTALPAEVIVVDASDVRSSIPADLMQTLRIRHIYDPSATIPQARKRAISAAACRYVLFVDDDCLLRVNSIALFKEHISKNPAVDFLMGDIVPDEDENPYAAIQDYFYRIWMLENFRSDTRSQMFANGKALHFDTALIKKTALSGVRFDITSPPGFQDDDIDIGEQLFRKGRNMVYDPSISTKYHPRNSLISLLRRGYLTGFSNEYCLKVKNISVSSVPFPISSLARTKRAFQRMMRLSRIADRIVFAASIWMFVLAYKAGRGYYYLWQIHMRGRD